MPTVLVISGWNPQTVSFILGPTGSYFQGDVGLSSGKSEAKKDPMSRKLPFSQTYKKTLLVGNLSERYNTEHNV